MDPSFLSLYCRIAARKFLFFCDPQRRGRGWYFYFYLFYSYFSFSEDWLEGQLWGEGDWNIMKCRKQRMKNDGCVNAYNDGNDKKTDSVIIPLVMMVLVVSLISMKKKNCQTLQVWESIQNWRGHLEWLFQRHQEDVDDDIGSDDEKCWWKKRWWWCNAVLMMTYLLSPSLVKFSFQQFSSRRSWVMIIGSKHGKEILL